MADSNGLERLRQSALARLALDAASEAPGAPVGLALAPARTQLDLRVAAAPPELTEALGLTLPEVPNTVATGAHFGGDAGGESGGDSGGDSGPAKVSALWLGPDQWLITTPAAAGKVLEGSLRVALEGRHHSLVDLSHARCVLRLEGPHAREILMRATPLDVRASRFGAGCCAQTVLARASMLLHCVADEAAHAGGPGGAAFPLFEIYVARSFAEYAYRWLDGAIAHVED